MNNISLCNLLRTFVNIKKTDLTYSIPVVPRRKPQFSHSLAPLMPCL